MSELFSVTNGLIDSYSLSNKQQKIISFHGSPCMNKIKATMNVCMERALSKHKKVYPSIIESRKVNIKNVPPVLWDTLYIIYIEISSSQLCIQYFNYISILVGTQSMFSKAIWNQSKFLCFCQHFSAENVTVYIHYKAGSLKMNRQNCTIQRFRGFLSSHYSTYLTGSPKWQT